MKNLVTTIRTAAARTAAETAAAGVLWRAGMFPRDPRALRAGAKAVARLGQLGGLPAYCAAVHPDRVAIIDDSGALTGAQFADRAHRLANALRAELPGPRTNIGILCRNHADAVVTLCAASAAGARVVLLNSDFGPRQVAQVAGAEALDAIVYDDDFAAAVADFPGRTWCAWHPDAEPDNALGALLEHAPATPPPRPPHRSALVILTSGSTGAPKGAPRNESPSLLLPAGLLSRISLRGNERVLVSAPVFHGWGLLIAALTLNLGSTLVLRRRFDAERALDDLQELRCSTFIAVPTMLRRMLALGERVRRADLSALRIVASGGARLDAALVGELFDVFGPVLHNLYGSTEAAYISIATPQDLAAAPDTAGRPPVGNIVRIADVDGRALPSGTDGRILVRTHSQIKAYTDGRSGCDANGFLDTGDLGHLDADGRLHVIGRSDGMIISGGENVFPEEVELTLLAHPGIEDAAVSPVDDSEFGQRLCAFVVVADPTVDAAAIRAHLAAELPRSRMPRDIVLVPELPRSAAGKVLRRTFDELKEAHS